MTATSTPLCPECLAPTVPLPVDGENIWRCSAPECGRRTYGTCDPDDDQDLPSYTETDADGTVLIYHGTGHLDLEATAELASQNGPDEADEETAGFLVIPTLDLAPGTLLVAVGPGASGKSTYADTVVVDAVVSLDALRHEIGGDAGDQSVTPAAVERQNNLLEWHLSAGETVFLDSTNVEPRIRTELVARARWHGRPVVALRFLPDLDLCLARNELRPLNRRVPEETLRWQHALTQEATVPTLLGEGFTSVHHIEPAPTGATMSKDTIAPERIADAVAVLRKAQEGDEEARVGLAEFFPEYECLVMETDYARYLEAAANAGMVATHLLIMECGEWAASVETSTSDFGMPLASVAVGGYYTSRTEAIREAVRAATDNGWTLAPESDWTDFDCGGGEIHIPIHVRPAHDQAQASPADVLPAEGSNRAHEMSPLPEVRFAVITDPDRQHAFFVATIAGDLDRLVGAYASERDM
ncbi:AAA family ATPase [Streptomyces anulatus]|uniref:AAA family ATPase n=1 Tax=Streptomyces anulatus TaxID=1892 RepID=UPI003B80FA45